MRQDDIRWCTNLAELKAFIDKNGRLPIEKDNLVSTTGTNLRNWLVNQRAAYRNGTLSAERVRDLSTYLGAVWENYKQGIKPKPSVPEIPDKGVDFSISTLCRAGIIPKSKCSKLWESGILYASQCLKSGVEITGKQIYELLVSRGMNLPKWWVVALYEDIGGRYNSFVYDDDGRTCKFLNMYLRQNKEDIARLREFGEYIESYVSRIPEKNRDVLVRYYSGEGLASITKSYGVTKQSVVGLLHRCMRGINRDIPRFADESKVVGQNENPLELQVISFFMPYTVRGANALYRAGYRTVGEVLEKCEYQVSDAVHLYEVLTCSGTDTRLRQFGRSSARDVSRALVDFCNKYHINYK